MKPTFYLSLPPQLAPLYKIQQVKLGSEYIRLAASSYSLYVRGPRSGAVCSSLADLPDRPHITFNTSYIAGSSLFNLLKAIVHAYLSDTSHSSWVGTMFHLRLELSESRGLHLLQPHLPQTTSDLQSIFFSSSRREPSVCLSNSSKAAICQRSVHAMEGKSQDMIGSFSLLLWRRSAAAKLF